jgi:hypothetical protein
MQNDAQWLKEFEEAGDEEGCGVVYRARVAPHHQGRMEIYSDEAQEARKSIRNHCRVTRQLLRWWNAALVFDDRDDGNYASIPATTNRARRTLHTHFEWSWSFSTKTTTQVVI